MAGLRRFAGEMRRNRERSGSRSFPQGQRLRHSCERRKILHHLGILSLADHQGDIDVFENLTGSDAQNAVRRFDKVVAFAARVLTAKSVGEGKTGVELLGFDEEASAVCDPGIYSFHGRQPGSKS